MRRLPLLLSIAFLSLFSTSCGSPTDPDTPTGPPASPSVNEAFVGTLKVGGSAFYSFSVSQYGTVTLTLNAMSGEELPEGATLNLGLGKPEGVDCIPTTNAAATPGTTPQLTTTFQPGVYCSKVTDSGILVAPATFDVTIAHP